jgi:hypothetical protein
MEMSGWMLALLILAVFSTSRATNIVSIRGGATKDRFLSSGNVDYYEQFDIDYGIDDNHRKAGSLRGFIRSGALASIPQSDSFLQWLQSYTEEGPVPYKGRLKAYHAADFGNRTDLKPGENPKLVIVNRKLQADKSGYLSIAPANLDVEIREIWQPWLKSKCNFAVRYIVPDRVNIIKILEAQNRFSAELRFSSNKQNSKNKEKSESWISMTFKPTVMQRLLGKKPLVIKHKVDESKLI